MSGSLTLTLAYTDTNADALIRNELERFFEVHTPLESLCQSFFHGYATVYQHNRPSSYVDMQRFKTIKRVEKALQKKFGDQYTLQPFGSTEYGIDNDASDLDLIVLVCIPSPNLRVRDFGL